MEQLTLENALLSQDLKEFFERKALIDELTAKNKELNAKIVGKMQELGSKKFSDGEYTATIALKENYKYTDEKKMIDMIRNDFTEEDANKYIIQVIDTKAFNELLKSSPSTAELFKDTYTKTPSTSITVKKI